VAVRKTADLAQTVILSTTLPSENGTLRTATDEFSIAASRNLNSTQATELTNYTLHEAGGNGIFGDGDDVVYDLALSFNGGKTVTFTTNPHPLQPGKYRFESKNLKDFNGNP